MWNRTLWNLQLHKIFSEQTELSELKVAEEEGEQGREIDSCTGKRENGENVKILQKRQGRETDSRRKREKGEKVQIVQELFPILKLNEAPAFLSPEFANYKR